MGKLAACLLAVSLVTLVITHFSRGADADRGRDGRPAVVVDRAVTLRPGSDFAEDLRRSVEAVNRGQVDVLRFTAGEFVMPAGLKLNRRMGEGGLAITGAGEGITRLLFTEVDCGLEVRLDTDIRRTVESPSFRLENLSLVARGNCGTAVRLMRGSQDLRGGTAAKMLSKLSIDSLKGGWSEGIVCSDLAFCSFKDITLRMPRPGATGILITGDTAPVDHHLSGIRVLSANTGIRIEGDVEGVYIDQATLIGVEVGIEWNTTGHEPLLALSGSHISARQACVRANNLLQPVITGNLLYQAGPDHPWTGIDIITERSTAYDLLQISHNTLHGNPNHKHPTTGISIEAGSAGALHSNVFSAVSTGIRLGAKAEGIEPASNVFSKTGKPLHRGARK